MKTLFYFAILLALATPAMAEKLSNQNLSESPSGRDALEIFNTVPQYLSLALDQRSAQLQLGSHCDGTSALNCNRFLLNNKNIALAAIPNNPAYWRAFHVLLTGPPLELETAFRQADDPRSNSGRLIEAAYHWVYKAIAEHDGKVDVDQFVLYYKNYRRILSQCNTLLDRMVFLGLVGTAHQQAEMLTLLYGADSDLGSLNTLSTALTPFTQAERSWRQTLAGEAQFAISQRQQVDESADQYGVTSEVPPAQRQDVKDWLDLAERESWAQTAGLISEITERNWADYWGKGIDRSLINEIARESPFFVPTLAYVSYIGASRSTEVMIYPLQALLDIYLGRVSPGMPAQAAPPYWTWENRSHQICLVPTNVAPNTTEYTVENPACVTYQEPSSY